MDAELEKKQDFLIYNSLMNKLNTLVEKGTINSHDLIHDSYFVEEMLILYKLKSITYALDKDDDQIIEEAKKYYISREERTGDKLRKLFEQYKGTDCTKTVEWITADLEKKDGGYPVF